MKTLTTLGILLMSAFIVNGQDSKLSLGVTGSTDFYNFDFRRIGEYFETFDTDLNASFGVSARYRLRDNLGLNLKILYATRDFTVDHNFRFIDPNDPGFSELPRRTSVELAYLDLPIAINYTWLKKNNVDVFFSAGIAPGFLLSDDESTVFENNDRRNTTSFTTGLNTFLIGGFLGAGIQYHLMDRLSIVLEPQYRYFFNRISDEIEDSPPQLFSIAVGAEIKF